MIDLSKVFDCVSHDLVIAKLNAYGSGENAINVIHNYLFGRSPKNNVGSSLSDLLDGFSGIPQGSIIGPLIFYINL